MSAKFDEQMKASQNLRRAFARVRLRARAFGDPHCLEGAIDVAFDELESAVAEYRNAEDAEKKTRYELEHENDAPPAVQPVS